MARRKSFQDLGHAEDNDPGVCSNCGQDLKSAVSEQSKCAASPAALPVEDESEESV